MALALCCGGGYALWASETPQSYSDLVQSTLQALRTADEKLTQLESLWPRLQSANGLLSVALQRAKQESDGLRSELSGLRLELDGLRRSLSESMASLTVSQAALTKAQVSLVTLTAQLEKLSDDFSTYRTQAERIARSRGVWRAVGLGAIVAAVVAVVVAVAR